MKIAIIDDEPLIRTVLKKNFLSQSYEVSDFDSGGKFLDAFKNDFLPDAIFLDIVMPKMDGVTVFYELKKLSSRLPLVIFMSGFDATGKVNNIVNNETIFFISKPFSLGDLNKMLEKGKHYIKFVHRCQSSEENIIVPLTGNDDTPA